MGPFNNCKPRYWLHKMILEIYFLQENKYMTKADKYSFFNRILKKYREQDPTDFDFFFSDEQIVAMKE